MFLYDVVNMENYLKARYYITNMEAEVDMDGERLSWGKYKQDFIFTKQYGITQHKDLYML